MMALIQDKDGENLSESSSSEKKNGQTLSIVSRSPDRCLLKYILYRTY